VVVRQLPWEDRNAMMHLFSAQEQAVRFGMGRHLLRSNDTSTLLRRLFKRYQEEGTIMPDALQELTRQVRAEVLAEMTPEERLKGLPAEERLKGLPAEERLKGLPAEERLKGLTPEERMKGLTPEEREHLRRLLESE
jgi:hypothetical protein